MLEKLQKKCHTTEKSHYIEKAHIETKSLLKEIEVELYVFLFH
ncbi:12071_t:CDS:2 [Funneliformis caledonium]|uniref:12071_t:CDS:1 n=1 Tax=Funneliformis caledonium TaxID=1117310 RepID=A0A9N8W7K4_9GLOM|nr:12071_t:CDS:2 [Funneliformis caledonium]